jgi:hypothetical protein
MALSLAFLFAACFGTACASIPRAQPLIYPAGFPTGEALRDGEWLLAPPPWGWVAAGVTDQLTIGWDYPATLFGYPAGLVRYQIPTGDTAPKLAVEAYGVWFSKPHTDERQSGFKLERHGTQDWLHVQTSVPLSDNWKAHAYGGFNYATFQRYLPHEGVQFEPVTYENHISPDYGFGLQWYARPSMMISGNYTYGNTLYFVDQVALKKMFVASLLFAPFARSDNGFLRNLRVDLSAMYVNVPVAQYEESLPLPLFPTVYWQWGGN